MANPVLLAKEVERRIQNYLLYNRVEATRFELFKHVEGAVYVHSEDVRIGKNFCGPGQQYLGEVTSTVFNTIVSNMKRAGVINTRKEYTAVNVELISLTDEAYKHAVALAKAQEAGVKAGS